MVRAALILILFPALLLLPGRASACASCACGDPTLTLLGNEKPFENRLRFSFEYRRRIEKMGVLPAGRMELTEDRFSLGAAYAPMPSLFLGVNVPLVRKEHTMPSLAEEDAFGLGDIETSAKIFLFETGEESRRHLFGAVAGLRVPTSRTAHGSGGVPFMIESQPGSGAWTGNLGLWYGYFRDPLSVYLNTYVQLSSEGRLSYEAGRAFLASVTPQYQIFRQLAFQAGFDFRWSEADYQFGVRTPNTGGAILFSSPGLLWSPTEDLIIHAIVRLPSANGLTGDHKEGFYILGGITYDFDLKKPS